MFHPIKNLQALTRHVRREVARNYLIESAPRFLSQFPQMCCYSFDWIGTEINIDGRYDQKGLDHLMKIIGSRLKGRTTIDVGANIGNHAALFAEYARHVIAFEPHPITSQILRINMSRFDNVTIVAAGASDKVATVRAVSPKLNYGATLITDRPLSDNENEWEFSVAPLDGNRAIATADVAFMKLDVEGHEPFAIRGATELIIRNKPLIVFEQNKDAISNGTSESLDLIKSLGYVDIYALDLELAWRTPQWVPSILRKIFRIGESLIFGPAEYKPRIVRLETLERRSYPMIIASPDPLSLHD